MLLCLSPLNITSHCLQWNTSPCENYCSIGLLQGGRMYQRMVDVDMLNAIKSVLADVLSVSPLLEL